MITKCKYNYWFVIY